jgi:ribosomal protein S18 acetylase RimI-like enzyme
MASVRVATVEDVPAVVELWSRAAGPTRHGGQHVEALRLIERDPDALLVAAIDDRIVGTLIVGWDGWRCHLYRMAVEPDIRRSGIARLLVERARDRAAARGAMRLDAMVNDDNDDARAFWRSVGFELDTEDRRWSVLF